MSRMRSRLRFAPLVLAVCLAGSNVRAGDDNAGFWDTMLRKLDMKTTAGEPPAFVTATKPDPTSLHYIPTGAPAHPESVPVKSTDEIEAKKAELDAAQAAQLHPTPSKSAAAKPGPPKGQSAKKPASKSKQAAAAN